MAINNEQLNNEYIICPECRGSGKNNLGFACANCGGTGLGTFYYGVFLYWSLHLGRAMISMDHIKKKIDFSLLLVNYVFSFLGIVCFLIWTYSLVQVNNLVNFFVFWKTRDLLLLVFYLSLFSFMFLIYLRTEKERLDHRINLFKKRYNMKNIVQASTWAEIKTTKNKQDVREAYSEEAFEIIENSFLFAVKLKHAYITPLHIFFTALADKQVIAILSRLYIDSTQLLEKIKKNTLAIENSEDKTELSQEAKKVLIDAYIEASKLKQKKVTPKNFLIACLKNDALLKEILYDFSVDEKKIYNVILWFSVNEKLIENYHLYRQSAGFKPSIAMDRAYTAVSTPILNHFAYDLTLAAKWSKLDYCVARDVEVNNIFESFESGFYGVLLVGKQGVGKNSIVNGIAQAMVREEVPKFLQDKRLLELDANRLISGVDASVAQGRMVAIVDEINRAGNIVLFIKDIDNLIGITGGSSESLDLSEVLAGSIERKLIYCIASAQEENYRKYIEGKSLGEVMKKIEVVEPDGDIAIQIIESKISYFEGKYKVYFSYNAIEKAIEMSKKYIHDQYLPEKAIKILEMVAVRVARKRGEQSIVSIDDIAEIISELTHIPVTKIDSEERESLLKLEKKLHERVVGQDEAINEISASLRRARTEIRENKRPIASFLFLGPTGVGKTELAKAVADIYFGDEKYMIRLDMSEYQEKDSIKKMIGDNFSKGYLTEAVRKTPFALILLDEFEKAHSDISNLFLQVFDDGRLTDGEGQTIDFTNTIIIATSNIGALFIQQEVLKGTDIDSIKNTLINEYLNKFIKPELVNRFDGITVFEPISSIDMIDITRIMIIEIEKMLAKKGINFYISEKGLKKLAKKAYDPKFGARPLRRLLQDKIENEIANKILSGELERRDTLVIDDMAQVVVEKGREI